MNSHDKSTTDCSSGCSPQRKIDYLFWVGIIGVSIGYILHISIAPSGWVGALSGSIYDLLNQIWLGLGLGVLALGFIGKIPKEIVQSAVGKSGTFSGIMRACLAGLFLDLCNHGILMVAAKLYERGVSYGQVLAFLIASPWNSLSLTLILFSLIGVKWTLLYILGSLVIAIITGCLTILISKHYNLPQNPNTMEVPSEFRFIQGVLKAWRSATFDRNFFTSALISGIKEAKMIVKWILIGTLLAGCLSTFVPADILSNYFGPSILGVFLTLGAATIIEVCSEGSAPVATEFINRGQSISWGSGIGGD